MTLLPPGRPLITAATAKQCCAWECQRGSHRFKNQTVVTRFCLSSHGPQSLGTWARQEPGLTSQVTPEEGQPALPFNNGKGLWILLSN